LGIDHGEAQINFVYRLSIKKIVGTCDDPSLRHGSMSIHFIVGQVLSIRLQKLTTRGNAK
jgi:hypothetical protein